VGEKVSPVPSGFVVVVTAISPTDRDFTAKEIVPKPSKLAATAPY